jgi:hypothetical protein
LRFLEDISLNNNNRGNNNRRRGRGNNRQQGGQPVNRIDSRARGNAQQMLDKYRKLAHDAHLNGDRVQEEYYLQFADHYFRVLADQRQRQEETRLRRDDRPQDGGERPRFEDSRGRDDYADFDEPGGDEQSQPDVRDSRGDDRERGPYDADASGGEGETEVREGEPYEPADNPFVRDNRDSRGARGPARSRGPRRESRSDAGDEPRRDERSDRPEAGLEPSVLPPPIGGASAEIAEDDEAPAKPRRRTRKPRDIDGNDESLEAVG